VISPPLPHAALCHLSLRTALPRSYAPGALKISCLHGRFTTTPRCYAHHCIASGMPSLRARSRQTASRNITRCARRGSRLAIRLGAAPHGILRRWRQHDSNGRGACQRGERSGNYAKSDSCNATAPAVAAASLPAIKRSPCTWRGHAGSKRKTHDSCKTYGLRGIDAATYLTTASSAYRQAPQPRGNLFSRSLRRASGATALNLIFSPTGIHKHMEDARREDIWPGWTLR